MAMLAPTALLADVTGRVEIHTAPRTGPSQAIVYAEPVDRPAPARPATPRLLQRDKTFIPAVIVVPVGSTVDFPNQDDIFHNVFSLSAPAPFDLGLYRAGATKKRTFAQPGTYRVFCNIHPQMTAFIVVVPTPYVATVGEDGRTHWSCRRGLGDRAVGSRDAHGRGGDREDGQRISARHHAG